MFCDVMCILRHTRSRCTIKLNNSQHVSYNKVKTTIRILTLKSFLHVSTLSGSFSWIIASDSYHISFSSTNANVDLQMCLYKPEPTKKHKSLISQLLSPFGCPPSLWTVSCELSAPSSTERDVAIPHDIAQSSEYSQLQCGLLHLPEPKNILNPIKVSLPNLSCWGLTQSPACK